MARLAAVMANGGKLVRPHLVKSVGGAARARSSRRAISASSPRPCAVVREGMRAVVAEGTGWRARLAGIDVARQDGLGPGRGQRRASRRRRPRPAIMPHGWFVAFAPADKPRIALAVLVEHGGSGGEAAAPVAREILAALLRPRRGGAPAIAGAVDTEARGRVAVIDRRLLFNVDWVLAGERPCCWPPSAWPRSSPPPTSGRSAGLYLKQLYLVGARARWPCSCCLLVDYRRLADRAILLYVAWPSLVLVYVLVFGPRIAGTRRWFLLGGFQLQPSEFVKLVAALFVAKVFAESRQESLGLARHRWARARRSASWPCSSPPSPTSAPRSAWCRSS